MKTFKEWINDNPKCLPTREETWNASAENSAEEIANLQSRLKGCTQEYERVSGRFDELKAEIAKRDERIASLIAAGAEYQRQFFEQSDQIKELSEDRDTWKARTEFSFQQRDALAAQNQQLRDALKSIQRYGLDTLSGRTDGPDDREWQRAGVNELTKRARVALSLPDIASPVLNRVKAEALRSAASCWKTPASYSSDYVEEWLYDRADAIEKGEV